MRPAFAAFLALITAALAAQPARANDSIAELATGGLVLTRSAEIEMAREDLRISPDRIEVDYVFRNRSARDIAATVAFPMPEIGGPDGDMFAIPDRAANFLDFTVTQDGRAITPALEARAFAGEREVTALLAEAGVPLLPVDPGISAALDRLPAEMADDWAKQGLIRVEDYDDGTGMRAHRAPQWTTRSTWSWQTVFPAKSDIHVAHSYRPSLGGSAGLNFVDYTTMRTGGAELADYRRRYCMDDAFLAAVDRRHADAQGALSELRLAYVLGTGANWAGGRIGEFTLTVDKKWPDALVSFCGTGVEAVGPTRFRMTARDFTPPPLLEILIVAPPAAFD